MKIMEEKVFNKRYYLIFFSTIIGPLSTNFLVPLFEELRVNFGLSLIAFVALAISFYIFPFAIVQLFAGTFSDVMDKRKVVVLGYIIFISGMLIGLTSVFMGNYYLFLFAFLIQGIGFAFINPTILAILNIVTPDKKKGFIFGIYNSSAGVGITLGALLSGFLINFFTKEWRFLFVINPIIAIISLIFFLIALRNCEPLVCQASEIDEEGPSKIGATVQKLKEGLNTKIILLGFIGFSCFFSVITLVNTLNEQLRISVRDLSDLEVIFYVSLILTICGIISIVLSPVIGLLLKKVSPFIMLFIGFSIMLIIVLMPFGSTVIDFIIIGIIIYIGSAFIWPSLFKVAMSLNPEKSGTNSAIINSFRFTGYALVGIFYVLFGIPFIYIYVFIFNLAALCIILVVRRMLKK
jgi:MFS family permease